MTGEIDKREGALMSNVRCYFVLACACLLLIGMPNIAGAQGLGTKVTLQQATATFSQKQPNGGFIFSVHQTIDGNLGLPAATLHGWAISDNVTALTRSETAVWETVTDISSSKLTFRLHNNFGAQNSLALFRISITSDNRGTFADGQEGASVTSPSTQPENVTAN